MSKHEGTYRLFNCVRCGEQVRLCSSCDHGHIYCRGCAPAAARARVRRAGRRYQATPRGKLNHALRQRRYRERQAEMQRRVTHRGVQDEPQGCQIPPSSGHTPAPTASMPTASAGTSRGMRVSKTAQPLHITTSSVVSSRPRCSRCSTCCPPFARRMSLREWQRRRQSPRTPAPP